MYKRILSLLLCVATVFSMLGTAVIETTAGDAKQLFTVQTKDVSDGKLSYTVNVTANRKNIGGISLYVEYDSSVLEVSSAKPSITKSTSTGETQNFKGNYVHGIRTDSTPDKAIYSIVYINSVPVSTESVAKAFFDIEFTVIDSRRPITDVKFYCKEYYSTTVPDDNITVADGLQLFGDFTNTVTMEIPQVLTVEPSEDALKVSWAPVEGAAYYKVYRIMPYGEWNALDGGEVSADQPLEFYDSNLVSGTTYTYAVSAINAWGETSYGKGKACKYIAKPEISSCKNVDGGIEIKWNETAGASLYLIMRRIAGQTEWTKLTSRAASLDKVYKDISVAQGVKYEYDVVSATDTFQSINAQKGVEIIYIPIPELISISNTLRGVEITWKEVPDASRYTIYRWETGVNQNFLVYDAVSDTTYVDSNVGAGKTYAYAIQAHTDYGESGYKSTGYSIVRVPSTEVTKLTLERKSVKIEWAPVSGVNGYSIYRKEENSANWVKLGSVNSSIVEYRDIVASSGNVYNYAVCPVLRTSEGPKIASEPIFFISAPSNVTAQNIEEGIKVTWSAVGGAISYEVMRLNDYGEFTVIGTVSKDGKTEFIDTEDIQTNKDYVYCVKTVNPLGDSLDSPESNKLKRIEAIGTATPQLCEGGIKVIWEPVSIAEKYAVYRNTGADWVFLGTSENSMYIDTTVLSDVTYSYAVAAVIGDSIGVVNTENAQAIRYIAPPENVEAVSGKKNLTISWDSVPGAIKYSIYKADAKNDYFYHLADVDGNTFLYVDTNVFAGRTYKYAVRATNTELTSYDSKAITAEYLDTPVITSAKNEYYGVDVNWRAVTGAKGYIIYSKTKTTPWKILETVDSNVTKYTDESAVNGQRMYYAVRAISDYGMSGFMTYACDYLTAPVLTLANTSTGIKLTWKQNKSAEYYYVYRKVSTAKAWTRIATTSKAYYDDNKAAQGVTYLYTIRAVNEPYMSGFNKTGWGRRYLKTPVQKSVYNDYGSVVVTWGKITGATGYIVYRKVDGDKNWTRLGTVKTTYYRDENVVNHSNYRYAVRSYYGNSSSGYVTGKINKYVEAPKLAVSNTYAGIQLKWSRIGGASSYYIYRKAASAKSWTKIATVTTNSYTDLKVKTGVKYTYTIKAYGSKSLSGYNKTGWAIVFLTTPKISSIASKTNGVNLKWNKISGAGGYAVYRKLGEDGSWIYLGKTASGSSVSYVDKTAKKGYTYTYTVRACRGAAKSSFYSGSQCKVKY